MRFQIRLTALAAVVLLASLCLLAQDRAAKLSARGDVQNPMEWSIEELKTQFAGKIQDVKFLSGKEKQSRVGIGIPLLSVIQAAGLKTDKGIRHHDLKYMAIVEAYDSYQAFFSVAELMPEVGNAQAWLVWNVDGKPLPEKEAPLRLVVSSDQAGHRQIFGVVKIILVDGAKLAGQSK